MLAQKLGFGADLVRPDDGTIDRAKLGRLVFGPGNEDNLKRLEGIVWPEIWAMAMQSVRQMAAEGKKVVVLDASVLLAANWEGRVHQVWVCLVDRPEAVRRIMERDGKTEEEANKRLQSQLSNAEFVRKANVVFCSKWDKEFTASQVDKAWTTLMSKYIH